MAHSEQIELDVDAVFPRFGAPTELRPRVAAPYPLPNPPPHELPPPPESEPVLLRLQEDVELVIETTSRRLDESGHRQDEFEQSVHGLLRLQARRINELKQELEHNRELLRQSRQEVAELADRLDRQTTRSHELHARHAIAIARIEALAREGAPREVELGELEPLD